MVTFGIHKDDCFMGVLDYRMRNDSPCSKFLNGNVSKECFPKGLQHFYISMVSFSLSQFYFNPSLPNPGRREKIKLNFYFHTSFWCLERFYEGLKDHLKTFWGTTKKCENKNLTFISIQLSEMHGTGRVNSENNCNYKGSLTIAKGEFSFKCLFFYPVILFFIFCFFIKNLTHQDSEKSSELIVLDRRHKKSVDCFA